jgi:hypothetical protein
MIYNVPMYVTKLHSFTFEATSMRHWYIGVFLALAQIYGQNDPVERINASKSFIRPVDGFDCAPLYCAPFNSEYV